MIISIEKIIQLPINKAVCHAWRYDRRLLACCHGNPEVIVYKVSAAAWEQEAVLKEHDQVVSSMHWSRSGLLVTCSHDRTSYVWSQVCLTFKSWD